MRAAASFSSIRLFACLATACGLAAQSAAWSQASFATRPSARDRAAMCYDSARGVLVLFGGDTSSGPQRDTWECDGFRWQLRNNANPRPPGFSGAMAAVFDSQRQRTVLVACDAPSSSTQTWEWDGTAWSQRSSGGPPGRYGFSLAFDSQRARTVLFGGRSGSLGNASDTWEWDGTSWLQRGTGGPPGRYGQAMCYDAARGVVVLYGGVADNPAANYADTWEWNGSWWLERFGVGGPSQRFETSMAFDAAAGRTVLFGGRNNRGSSTGLYAETWEWDGSQWLLRPANGPSARHNAAIAYDAANQRIVLFGGYDSTGNRLDDCWLYAIVSGPAAAFTTYGSGCAGPVGVPVLASQGSLPRIGATLQLRLSSLPSSPLNLPLIALGSSDTNWNGVPLPLALDPLGMPGCQALLAPEATYPLVNAGGTADWNLAIPFAPRLVGLDFYLQGAVLVPSFNPGGVVFSNAGHGVIGVP